MTDEAIEAEIQAKGLTAPRITPESIEAKIIAEHYFTARDGLEGGECFPAYDTEKAFASVTICAILLSNGFKIIGVNTGPVSAKNYDSELGRKLARQNAIDQIWSLEGYLLRQRLNDALHSPERTPT